MSRLLKVLGGDWAGVLRRHMPRIQGNGGATTDQPGSGLMCCDVGQHGSQQVPWQRRHTAVLTKPPSFFKTSGSFETVMFPFVHAPSDHADRRVVPPSWMVEKQEAALSGDTHLTNQTRD